MIGASQNAMTEIALALAMAFFSIMVLTMVSMGAGEAPPQNIQADTRETVAAGLEPVDRDAQEEARAVVTDEDVILVFSEGRYFDRHMQPVNVATRRFSGRVILALPPRLTVEEALDARAAVRAENLIVSTIDAEWTAALQRRRAQEN